MRGVRNWASAGLFAATLLAAPITAHAEWKRAESEHFVVYGHSDRSVREYASMLEDFDDLLRRLHGRPKDEVAARKLPVYLVGDLSDIQRVAPKLERIAGVYFSAPGEVFAMAIRDVVGGDNDQNRGDDAVLHEYVHHFMLRYYPSAYPTWLVEGYAEYYMTADLGQQRLTVGGFNAGRARTLTRPGGWIPMEKVLGGKRSELKKDEGGAFYAQAWLLTHYIVSDPERYRKLRPYLEAARTTHDPVAAWKTVYGDTPDELGRKLKAYMDKPIPAGALPRKAGGEANITITTLSPGADDLLLEGQRLKLGVPEGDRPAFLASVRKRAARQPNDRFSRLVLARAETRYGDRAAGEAALNTLLTDDPKDLDALIVLGESRLAVGRTDPAARPAAFAEAGKLFARAFKIDADDPVVLRGYADSQGLKPVDENIVNVRLKALQVSPQVAAYRLEAAKALIATKDLDLARSVLAPLAASPHGGEQVEAAQAMLKAIDGEPRRTRRDKAGR
jgi:tetratricopeptide (TPR) repeat protein